MLTHHAHAGIVFHQIIHICSSPTFKNASKIHISQSIAQAQAAKMAWIVIIAIVVISAVEQECVRWLNSDGDSTVTDAPDSDSSANVHFRAMYVLVVYVASVVWLCCICIMMVVVVWISFKIWSSNLSSSFPSIFYLHRPMWLNSISSIAISLLRLKLMCYKVDYMTCMKWLNRRVHPCYCTSRRHHFDLHRAPLLLKHIICMDD